MKHLVLATTCVLFFSCASQKVPSTSFETSLTLEEPNYSLLDYWNAHPEKKDFADTIPKEAIIPENQSEAPADVFFLHPTTYYGKKQWNADINDQKLNWKTDKRAIKHQASAFNAGGRVFAPRYRQMVYNGFYSKTEEEIHLRTKALSFAYADIRKAFQYYLDHYNDGRPIIIAGHSQGCIHANSLIKEFFDDTALQDQLVAAYLIGFPFKASEFKTLKACNSPTETGCLIGWGAYKYNTYPKEDRLAYYKDAVVVNPLNWQTTDSLVSENEHQGFLGPNFKSIKRKHIFAQIHEGFLWVKKPLPIFPGNNYHIADINLFWADIRQNVIDRAEAYLSQQSAGEH